MFKTFCALSASLLLFGGCGGGGGSAPSTDNTIPQSVQIITDADALAYQKGGEGWKADLKPRETLANGEKRYTFTSDGRYGVAMYCSQDKHLLIFQLTTEESSDMHFSCGNGNTTSSPVSGTISDQAETPDGFAVAMERDYSIVTGVSGNYALNVPDGTRDLIAVSLKTANNKTVPQRFYIERDLSVTGADIAHTVTLTTANTAMIEGYPFTAQNGTVAEAYLITKNETFFTAAIDGSWYIPKEKLIDDDLYTFYAASQTNNTMLLEAVKATAVAKEARDFDAAYIQPLTGVTYDNSAAFGGLGYQPSAQSQPLRAYITMLEKTQGRQNVDLILSKGWLGDAATYTIPALQTLNGFQSAWLGNQADKANISALMSNKSIAQMLSSTKIFTPHESDLFLLPGIRYEVAAEKIF